MRLRHLSYQIKLFLIFTLIILGIGTVMVSGFYLYIKGNLRESSSVSMQQISEGIATKFNYSLSNMNVTASQICSDEGIQSVMIRSNKDTSATNYFDINYQDKSYIVSRLYTINSPLLISARISIFDPFQNYINYGWLPTSKTNPNEFFSEYQFIEKFKESSDSFLLFPPTPDHWNDASPSPTVTFSLIREIHDLDTPTFPNLGYVEIQQPYSLLESICTYNLPKDFKVQILDENGQVVYPYSVSDPEDSIISLTELQASEDNAICSTSSIVYCCTKTSSPWTIVLYQGKDVFIAPEVLIRNYMLLLILLFYAACIFLIYNITQNVTRPIKDMVNNLEHISIEDTSLKLDLHSTNNELILLQNAFETTFERLAESSKREIQAQANESYSHMLALQAQMNPHFLYNTLMALNGLALQKEYDKISMMCSQLSAMLRYTASYNEQNITIGQECEYTQAYLDLMKIRYDDFLQYSIECDNELKTVTIPKLLIQPVVENCFKHAFSNTLPPYKISIKIYRRKENWLIQVCDNGCGFDEKYISEFFMQTTVYENETQTISSIIQSSHLGGMGMKNLYVRLKLYLKDAFIFKMENRPEGGGCVTIGGKFDEKNTDR